MAHFRFQQIVTKDLAFGNLLTKQSEVEPNLRSKSENYGLYFIIDMLCDEFTQPYKRRQKSDE